MSAAHQGNNNQQPSTTWTEPPWSGWIETTGDALLILEAARRGLIPRVTRRLVDSERKMITSGSVFVFDEDESGIKRWTDGFFWSPSRILGNFLLYRETDKRGAGHRGARPDPDMNEQPTYNMEGVKLEGQSLSRPKSEHTIGVDKHRERTLMGSLTNSYKFKPDGLMKKTFSLTIDGVAQHLISYYRIEDVENGRLRAPSSLPELASLEISPEYLDKTHFRNPPKVEIGADGIPRYRGEADDIDTSPGPLVPGPLSSGLPLLTDGHPIEGSSNKRGKRYDPYSSPAVSKRPRKNTKSQPPADTSQVGESSGGGSISPPMVAATMPPPGTVANPMSPSPIPAGGQPFPDPNVVAMVSPTAPYPPYGVPGYYQVPPGYGVPPMPYPQGAYTQTNTSSSASPPQQQPMVPHNGQYSYAGYPPPPPPSTDPSQAGTPQAHFYPYYAPPPPPPSHPSYPAPYPPVAWPHYAGYPPQPHLVQHPPPPPPPATGEGDKTTQDEGKVGTG